MSSRKAGKGRSTRAPKRALPTLARACIGEVKDAPSIKAGKWNKLFLWALEDAPINNPDQRLVLANLVCRINSSLTCFPSIEYIRKKTGLGRNRVYRALKELQSAGLIERKLRGREGKRGGQTTPYYRLIFTENTSRQSGSESQHETVDNPVDNSVGNLLNESEKS